MSTNLNPASAETWIPLMDYAMKTGVSLSTLRRHIKANKIPFRVENGRYLLPSDASDSFLSKSVISPAELRGGETEMERLQAKLRKAQAELSCAQEEIVELKTLIAFYEDSDSGLAR